jgi:DNA-binding transcriptional ArsR family regulator
MDATPPLQPTLWRTCRALANHTRLQMLQLLVQQPGQSVSAVAGRLKQPMPVTSEYLRALEARGLLKVRRVGRRVKYQPCVTTGGGPAHSLGAVLRSIFKKDGQPVETLFKLATAFTHPRRIEIFRALKTKNESLTLDQIKAATGISARALLRHLDKLEARGFVKCRLGAYSAAQPGDPFGRELARLAAE